LEVASIRLEKEEDQEEEEPFPKCEKILSID
jgi:hypothetical protein